MLWYCTVFSFMVKLKVKCTLVQALSLCTDRTAHKGSRGIAVLFLDHGIRWGEGSASRPGLSLPPGKTRYPLYRRLCVPLGRSEPERKMSPTGFDPRTAQPVASRYTDWAIRSTRFLLDTSIFLCPLHNKISSHSKYVWTTLCCGAAGQVTGRLYVIIQCIYMGCR